MLYKEGEFLKSLFLYGLESAAKTLINMFNKDIHISIDNYKITNEVCKIKDEIPLKQSSYYKNHYINIFFLLYNDDYLKMIYSLDTEETIKHNDNYYLKKHYYEVANIITGNLAYSLYNFFNVDYVSETPLALKNHIKINLCKDKYIDLDVSFKINNNILKSKVYVCLDNFYWDELDKLMEGLNYES